MNKTITFTINKDEKGYIECPFCEIAVANRRGFANHLKDYHNLNTETIAKIMWPRPEKIQKVATKTETEQ